jgi:hypothetical protein
MQANLSRGYGVIAFANLVEAPLHPCAVVLYAMSVLRAQSLGEALTAAPAPPDRARVMRAGDYDGAYTAAAMPPVRVVSRNDRLYLEGSGNEIALYPRGTDLFWADSPQFSLFLLSFGRDRQKRVVEMTYGSHWYANERYQGPRTFPYPPSWNALTGRYENTFFGQPAVTRAIVVKGRLTLDGISPLTPLRNGTFDAGGSIVRFDAFAGGHAQRLSIDDTHFYRIELP